MTSIFLKNIKETLVTKKANNTAQVTFDPLCTFLLTQKQSLPKGRACALVTAFGRFLSVVTGSKRPKAAARGQLL
jgi:hypothetical protein